MMIGCTTLISNMAMKRVGIIAWSLAAELLPAVDRLCTVVLCDERWVAEVVWS